MNSGDSCFKIKFLFAINSDLRIALFVTHSLTGTSSIKVSRSMKIHPRIRVGT